MGKRSGWGLEEVETSLPLGSCPTEIDKGTTGRGGRETGVTNSLGLSPNLDGTGKGVTTTTPVRGARGIFISISLGLGPDLGDTGGGTTNELTWGARDTVVSISLGLGPTNSFSDEVFTTDSDVIVWTGWTGERIGGGVGDGLSDDALRKNKSKPPTAEHFFFTRGGSHDATLGEGPPPLGRP